MKVIFLTGIGIKNKEQKYGTEIWNIDAEQENRSVR